MPYRKASPDDGVDLLRVPISCTAVTRVGSAPLHVFLPSTEASNY